ncbi:MAG TPA: preprotein translocase subunit SecA, partial [Candidatus Paceibacterota bacterium]
MFGILSKIFGSTANLQKTVELINASEEDFKKLTDEDLKEKTYYFRNELQKGRTLDDILPEAFAAVRESARRTLGQRHFDVQLMGGAVLHSGGIAEMLTGEGKTLAATAPVYLNALAGKGVHIVTVNEYLAKRDTVWMSEVYHALGLRVACLVHEGALMYDPAYVGESALLDKERDMTGSFRIQEEFLRPVTRREAYLADITYGTNHEFGFDYLRDNLVYELDRQVQRGHYFAIIDEVDSILIDESRTPLIISMADQESSSFYKSFARVVDKLVRDDDYAIDEKLKTASITDSGINKVERMIGVRNIYAPENLRLVHYMEESLKAKALYLRDRDYLVKDGEVIIVDQFTGRMMLGRRYSGGLHQAIEAKEGVLVKEESQTYARITIQNYFRKYEKLAGMTGTAQTSAEEFHKVYNLEVVSIPPNKPLVRDDMQDAIYRSLDEKYRAVAREIKERREKGQPVLLGTPSIEKNEIISGYLKRAGIPHEVLNAKNNEREGAIIAQAGKPGAVTVATNMAGRGV